MKPLATLRHGEKNAELIIDGVPEAIVYRPAVAASLVKLINLAAQVDQAASSGAKRQQGG